MFEKSAMDQLLTDFGVPLDVGIGTDSEYDRVVWALRRLASCDSYTKKAAVRSKRIPAEGVRAVGKPKNHQHTISGGLTRDNVLDAYSLMGDALPLCALCNHTTALRLAKFHTNPSLVKAVQVLRNSVMTDGMQIEGVTYYITRNRSSVKDDVITVFGTDGETYDFEFV